MDSVVHLALPYLERVNVLRNPFGFPFFIYFFKLLTVAPCVCICVLVGVTFLTFYKGRLKLTSKV